MPMTRLEKMSGTTIDLIIRRKMVESGCRYAATSMSGQTEWSR